MDNAWLEMAIDAVQKNDARRARELLIGYTRYNRTDEQGWLWLSRVAASATEKSQCLERALQINPQNLVALRALGMNGKSHPKNGNIREYGRAVEAVHVCSNDNAKSPRVPRASPVPSHRNQKSAIHQTIRPSAPRAHPAAPTHWARPALNSIIFAISAILFVVVATAIVPMFFGNRTLVILSGSMEPEIRAGGIVVLQPVASKDLEIGDIIAYNPSAESQIPIVHRIVRTETRNGTRYYTTLGDANNAADPAEFSLPPTAWREVFTVPIVGYIIAYSTSTVGVILLIVVPILSFFFLGVWDWIKKKDRAGARVYSA